MARLTSISTMVLDAIRFPFHLILGMAYVVVYSVLYFIGIWLDIFWVSFIERPVFATESDPFTYPEQKQSDVKNEARKEKKTAILLSYSRNGFDMIVELMVEGDIVGWIAFDKKATKGLANKIAAYSDNLKSPLDAKVISLYPRKEP